MHSNFLRRLVMLVVLFSALRPNLGTACPAFVYAKDLKPLPGAALGDLRLFALTIDLGTKRHWVSLPLQVDPMVKTPEGPALATPSAADTAEEEDAKAKAKDPDRAALGAEDRIAFAVAGFGPVRAAGDGAPCQTKAVYEVQNPLAPGQFAYLAACSDAAKHDAPGDRPVGHMPFEHRIASNVFTYEYLPNNQLIFEKLAVQTQGQSVSGGSASDILLHLDPKKFFTLNLTNQNVQSFVEASRMGDMGLVGRIQFYMKVLFFKIDLHMSTTASWFKDSANLPMVMDVPVNAAEALNAGSGMLFNWLPDDGKILAVSAATTTPQAAPDAILKGPKALAAIGLKNCHGDTCGFRSEGLIGKGGAAQTFFIDMTVPKTLVEKGFYPSFVSDLGKFKKGVGWNDDENDEPADKGRVAIYFETSGLAKGRYKMDYWIRLGANNAERGSCPAAVSVKKAAAVSSPAVAH